MIRASLIMLFMAGPPWDPLPQAPAVLTPDGLTLRQAIAEALSASPALESSRDAIDRAAINERLQRSAFDLQLTPAMHFGTQQNGLRHHQAMVTASRRLPTGTDLALSMDWLQFGPNGVTDRDAGVTMRVSQSLVQAFGPALRAGVETAARGSASAARAHEESRRDLILRTAAAYFATVRQQMLVDAAGQARVRAGRLRDASAARSRAGLGTELDVMRADLMIAQADAAAASAHEALERARDELKMLLGRPVDSAITVLIGDGLDVLPAAPSDAAVDLANRADVRDARERVIEAERAATLARWAALPDVQLNVSYAKRGLGGTPSIYNEWLGGWRVGISTTYGLQRQAADAAGAGAELAVRAAEREADAREQAAVADLRAAQRAVARTAGAVGIQGKAIAIAERQARMAGMRFERGLADNVDLVDAEVNLLQARTALIGARVDHALARLALARAAGTLNPDDYRQ